MTETLQAPAGAPDSSRVAVIVPCHNEELTVTKVVADFRAALPTRRSWWWTTPRATAPAELARAAGAEVIRESRPGKGFALLSGFRQARAAGAEYFVMVDGDDTYPAERRPDAPRRRRAGARRW